MAAKESSAFNKRKRAQINHLKGNRAVMHSYKCDES